MPPVTLDLLIARNRSWATHSRHSDPSYFQRHQNSQTPQCLWISCADSRVPAENLVQASPGEMFVLRNVANQVLVDDDGIMSGVYYALTSLNIKMVVVCGHTGCGGVAYADQQALNPLSDDSMNTPLQRQLAALTGIYRQHFRRYPDLLNLPSIQRQQILAEINVRQQLLQLRRTVLFQALSRQQPIGLHGCIYDLSQGRLHVLPDESKEGGL